jgi:hypothetical protein
MATTKHATTKEDLATWLVIVDGAMDKYARKAARAHHVRFDASFRRLLRSRRASYGAWLRTATVR